VVARLTPSLTPLTAPAAPGPLNPLQILPVNDTCVYGMWWDSYPYSTLSVHALHPQYLALGACVEPGQELPVEIGSQVGAACGVGLTQDR
jgi:4-alpha-glucanotransferase